MTTLTDNSGSGSSSEAPKERPFSKFLKFSQMRGMGFMGWLLLAAGVVLLHMHAFPQISQIDELSHFDYVQRLAHGELVRWGDPVDQPALREEACRGLDRGDAVPPCDSASFSPGDFQDFGQNMAAKGWPVYYGATAVGVRVLDALPGIDSEFTAARVMGVAWLAGGLSFVGLLLRRHRVPRWIRISVGVLLATTPVIVHASATVNPDAGLLFVGAGIALFADSIIRGNLSTWFALLFPFAVFYDRSTILVIGACLIWIVGARVRRETVLAVGVAVVFAAGVFLSVSSLRLSVFGDHLATQPMPTPDQQQRQYRPAEIKDGSLDPVRVASELGAMVTPVKNPYLPTHIRRPEIIVVAQLLDWMLLAGVAVALFRSRNEGRGLTPLAAGVALMMCSGPLQVVINHWRDGLYYAPNARFGLSLLAALALLLATSVRNSWAQRAVVALAAGGAVTFTLAMVLA